MLAPAGSESAVTVMLCSVMLLRFFRAMVPCSVSPCCTYQSMLVLSMLMPGMLNSAIVWRLLLPCRQAPTW